MSQPNIGLKQFVCCLFSYMENGIPVPPELCDYIEHNPQIEPELRQTLVSQLRLLPQEEHFFTRNVIMNKLFQALQRDMSTLNHQSFKDVLPKLQELHQVVMENIQGHDAVLKELLEIFKIILEPMKKAKSFVIEHFITCAERNLPNFAQEIRPIVELMLQVVSSPQEDCLVARLDTYSIAMQQVLAVMSQINHAVVREALPQFEALLRRQREIMEDLLTSFKNLLSNLVDLLLSYAAEGDEPFDMALLADLEVYGASNSCAEAWRPVVQAIHRILQNLPAMTCEDCRFDRVKRDLETLVPLVRDMARPVPGAVQILEEVITSIDWRRFVRQTVMRVLLLSIVRRALLLAMIRRAFH